MVLKKTMSKWLFIDKLLQPLCKVIDNDIAFLLPVLDEENKEVVTVNIGYKNNRIVRVNIIGDSLKAIVCDVIKHIWKDDYMKKFIKDVVEVGKDIWAGFVYIVDFAYELGEILASKFTSKNKTDVVELVQATKEVKRNVVLED